MVWFGSSQKALPATHRNIEKKSQLADGQGAKSYDRSSVNHSIHSAKAGTKDFFPFPLFSFIIFFGVRYCFFSSYSPSHPRAKSALGGGGGRGGGDYFFQYLHPWTLTRAFPSPAPLSTRGGNIYLKKDHSDFILAVPYCFEGSTGTVPYHYHTVLL